MYVSVIIPAYNDEKTISATLDSLLAQTFQQWQAIIVDDGSSDETASIAASYAQRDSRLRLVSQPHHGACAARNHGLSLATFDWLLFLDADDLLLPNHLQRMTTELAQNPQLDAVHCDWQRITLDGQILAGDPYKPRGRLFDTLARRPLFPPFACILHRSLVEATGAWDTSFECCQDWDLWQRCARTGAQFGAIDEVLGYYCMRPHSLSTSRPYQLLRHGLRVIATGYGVDERVRNPAREYATGLITPDEARAKLVWLSWCAGLALGLGHDTAPLLQLIQAQEANINDPGLDPYSVADCLFRALPYSLGQPPDIWLQLWPQREQQIDSFLSMLEEQTQAPELAIHAKSFLELRIVNEAEIALPLTLGHTHAILIDVAQLTHATQRPSELAINDSVKNLICKLSYAGHGLGDIMLRLKTGDRPMDGDAVSPVILADAIAQKHAWHILGHFFENTIYPHLRLEREADTFSLWRGDLCLAQDIPPKKAFSWSELHDDIGWTIFLQEVWGKPSWPTAAFYNPQHEPTSAFDVYSLPGKLHIEVSNSVPGVLTHRKSLTIIATVGGAKLGDVTLPVTNYKVSAQEIRAAVTSMADFALCRLAVRQALIGRPLNDPTNLRQRLQQAAASSR